MGNTVKIFFVATLESGRVKPADLYTIKEVMKSITLPDGRKTDMNNYGLIINKCTCLQKKSFSETGEAIIKASFMLRSDTVPFTTSYCLFVPNSEQAVDEENVKVMCPELMEFVLGFPGIESIKSAGEIDVRNLEEKLAAEQQKHKAAMDELEQKMMSQNQEVLSTLQAEMDTQYEDMNRRLEKAQAERDASGGGIMGAMLDVTNLIAKPICKALDGDADNFEEEWLKYVGVLKKNVCIV